MVSGGGKAIEQESKVDLFPFLKNTLTRCDKMVSCTNKCVIFVDTSAREE
jgi:predicted nucleotidyltransferase